jgi:hypothetical protein
MLVASTLCDQVKERIAAQTFGHHPHILPDKMSRSGSIIQYSVGMSRMNYCVHLLRVKARHFRYLFMGLAIFTILHF